MRTVATMRRLSVTLPASGSITFPAAGNGVFVEAASVDLELKAYSSGEGQNVADGILVRKAASYEDWPTSYDTLTLTGPAGATCTLWTGEGHFNLNILYGAVSITAGGTFDSQANAAIGATSSLDIAADATQYELHMQVPPSNVGDLAVRDQSATTDEGILLGPNGLSFYQLGCSGAIRVRNNTAGALTLRYAMVKQ